MEVAGKKFQRPLTHDLMVTIIEGLKAKVTRVVISELRDNTYYAHIFLERRKEIVSIDARPSDSIALALRTKSPIFITDRLLDGQLAEAGAGEGGPEERPREKTEAERAEELRKRLEAMDPEDFGKFSL
jgi:bifunctional DNase/RNase